MPSVLHHLLFLKCHNLRFIGLDHCTDDKTGEGEDHTEWVCHHSLWVLDLHYTEWNEILWPEKMDLMDNLMENEDPIQNIPAFHEGRLVRVMDPGGN